MIQLLRDWWLELRIDACLLMGCRTRDKDVQRFYFHRMAELILKRSPGQIKRMTERMGLR